MKFQLFQRLRSDDGEEAQSTAQTGLGEPQMDGMDDSGPSGGGLERTVERMFDQGYSEEEIKQELQGQYSEQEIQDAVNQTVTNNAADQGSPSMNDQAGGFQQNQEASQNPFDQGMGNQAADQASPQQPQNTQPAQDQGMQQPAQQQVEPLEKPGGDQQEADQGMVDQRVEELIETVVAENFQRVTKEFENVYEELDLLEKELEELDHRVHDLEVRDDEDQQQFVEKVDEMEDHIDQYQSRIGGLEKAFQQVLPNLVDNVRDLTSLVQEMKQQEGIETQTDVSEQEVEEVSEELQDW
jgi:DNA repair exonuclease SbcCD ATPase subunit